MISARKDPATMSKDEYEKWYCTAYVTSVAKNVEEVMAGSRAKPIWQIASAEGALLKKLNSVMLFLTILALGASATAVSTSLMASMAERSPEIALMKAVGADRFRDQRHLCRGNPDHLRGRGSGRVSVG